MSNTALLCDKHGDPALWIPPLESKRPACLGKDKLPVEQKKLQGDSEPEHPNSASVGRKKVKINVTFKFQ